MHNPTSTVYPLQFPLYVICSTASTLQFPLYSIYTLQYTPKAYIFAINQSNVKYICSLRNYSVQISNRVEFSVDTGVGMLSIFLSS